MKRTFIIILTFFCFSAATAQPYNLSEKDVIISLLNKKTFIVPNYGEIRFKYDGMQFGMLNFEVEYTLISGKSRRTIDLYTEIPETNGGFHLPDFFKGMTLRKKNENSMVKREYPTIFELLENGELYYRDKPKMSFKDYYETTIKKGIMDFVKINFVLCPPK